MKNYRVQFTEAKMCNTPLGKRLFPVPFEAKTRFETVEAEDLTEAKVKVEARLGAEKMNWLMCGHPDIIGNKKIGKRIG